MNQYITGSMIREIREKKGLTQARLAESLNISDKTVSKWETGRGYPDISLLEPLCKALSISIGELIAGKAVSNSNISANMLRSQFYVCPICNNVLHATGGAVIHCHGIHLLPEIAEKPDDRHSVSIEIIEDEYYVHINHDMSKSHYISFIALCSYDDIQLKRLYPEGPCEARFSIRGARRLYYYCNQDGLFYIELHKK